MLKASANTNIIRKQDETSVIAYVALNSAGRRLAYDYLEENWQGLVERHGSTSFTLPSLIESITSRLSSNYHLQRIQDFIKKTPNLGVTEDAFEQAIENININIRWLITNLKPIVDWLDENY